MKVIEVGAGGGWNLRRLPAHWERIGYDVDEEYLAIGRNQFGVTMKHGFLEVALPDIADADVVLMSHVLEHLAHPQAMLATIAASMKPDALLLIEVPGIFRIHRTNFDVMSYMQSAHTFTFCATTLRGTCERAGLSILSLNEVARVVCRKGQEHGEPYSAKVPGDIAARIIRYLKLCELCYKSSLPVNRVPLAGKYLAYGWRRLYSPLLRPFVPRQA